MPKTFKNKGLWHFTKNKNSLKRVLGVRIKYEEANYSSHRQLLQVRKRMQAAKPGRRRKPRETQLKRFLLEKKLFWVFHFSKFILGYSKFFLQKEAGDERDTNAQKSKKQEEKFKPRVIEKSTGEGGPGGSIGNSPEADASPGLLGYLGSAVRRLFL